MNIDLRLAIVAAVTHLAAGQETGRTGCPCVTTTSWLAGATATSSGSQILQSSVGTATTDYPITYGLDGCQAYSASSSPSCVDLDTGVELTRRPAWCEDEWCYVDGDNCEIAGGAITSSLFPGAYLSYQTCASAATSTNTYEHLTEVGAGVTELTGIIENYLYASAAEAERVAAATSTAGYQTCDASMACPCNRCEASDDWHCSGEVDFKSTNLYYRTDDCPPGGCDRTASANQMKCMAGQVGSIFTRVADKEMGEETTRVGFQMFADQGSGGLLNWPAVDWCHKSDYEPRFRPWYSQSASGPKDVVIVIDISGSMGTASRISMAQDAVLKVIDTLTWADHASLILFDDVTLAYECDGGGIMCAMTDEEKGLMKTWAETSIAPAGGTNFDAAFRRAFEALQSAQTSACNKAILFMTDGQSGVDFASVRENAVDYGTRVMTYALGSNAQTDVCRQLACENGGVFTAVGDNDDLGLAMASYYKVFASGMSRTDQCRITWSHYEGSVTPVEFLSACLPVFKTQPGDVTCGGAPGVSGSADADEYAELLGVVCMDVSIIADLKELKKEADWDSWYQSNVIDASCMCPQNTLSHAQLQAVRASIHGAEMCDTVMHGMYDNTARAHTGGASTCGEGIEPVDGATTCGMRPGIIAAIVGAVVGGTLLVACLTYKLCQCLKNCCRGEKKKKKEKEKEKKDLDDLELDIQRRELEMAKADVAKAKAEAAEAQAALDRAQPPSQPYYGGGIPVAQATVVQVQAQPVGGAAGWSASVAPARP